MLGGSEILSPSESVEIADFVLFKMLGGIRNSELLRIGGNSRFRSVLSVGGIRNSEPLRIGGNSQFCSVLNVGGIRNSEPLRIGGNCRFLFCLKCWGDQKF